jgi:hypothetical protein
MLQFLLDDTLPSYGLPKRRLRAGRFYDWRVDTTTSSLSCKGYPLSTYHVKGVVAVRVNASHYDYETIYSMRYLFDTCLEGSIFDENKKLEWKDLGLYLE